MHSCFVAFCLLEVALARFQDIVAHQRGLGWRPTASSYLSDVATRLLDSGAEASCSFRRVQCSESDIVDTIREADAKGEALMVEGCSFEDASFQHAALSGRHQDAVVETRRIDVRLVTNGGKGAGAAEPVKTTMEELLRSLADVSGDAKGSHSKQYFDVTGGVLLQGLENPNSSGALWSHLVNNYEDSIDSVQFDTDLPLHNHGRTWLYVHVGSKLWVTSPVQSSPPALVQWGMPFQWMAEDVPSKVEEGSDPADWILRSEHFSGWKPLVCLQPPKSIVLLPQFWNHATVSIGTTIGFGKQSLWDASAELPEETPQAWRDILAMPKGVHTNAILAPEDERQEIVDKFEQLWKLNKYDLKAFDYMIHQNAQLGGKNRLKKVYARAKELIKEAFRLSSESGGLLHAADARSVASQIVEMVENILEFPVNDQWRKLLPKIVERLRKHGAAEGRSEL